MNLPDSVIAALRKGQKVEAIKRLRQSTGMGLAEAKEAVERFKDDYRPLFTDSLTDVDDPIRPRYGMVVTIALILSFTWALVTSISALGSAIVLFNHAGYSPATFIVQSLQYRTDDEGGLWWGFTGRIAGRTERFHAPDLVDDEKPDLTTLRSLFPVGTRLQVWYNPEVTDTLFQKRSLNVLPHSADLVASETERLLWWVQYALLPFAIILFLAHRRQKRPAVSSLPTNRPTVR